MNYILLLNREAIYPLLSFNMHSKDGDFLLTIQSDDFNEVKEKFSNIKKITILKGSTVIAEHTKYKTYSRISRGDDYYDKRTKKIVPTIEVVVSVPDLADQVANINEQLNINIDYDKISLDDYKKYKIGLSKDYLAEYLDNNPLRSSAHNGVDAYYSVTKEKQNSMIQQYLNYQIIKSIDLDAAELTHNSVGEVCEVWEENEFVQLLIEIKNYVQPFVSYQQMIEKKIMECATKDEVSDIVIDYNSVVNSVGNQS